jgi:hypothetical protein
LILSRTETLNEGPDFAGNQPGTDQKICGSSLNQEQQRSGGNPDVAAGKVEKRRPAA